MLPACVALFSTAPMYISTTEMGIIKMLEMVLIPIYGYFYTGEVPTTASWVGGTLLILTLSVHAFLSIREQSEQQQEQQQEQRCGEGTCTTGMVPLSGIEVK